MFLLSLAIFTLILTVFENIFLAFWVLIVILITYFFIRHKQTPGSNISVLLIIWAFTLAITSILIKNYIYNQKIDNFPIEQNYINSWNLISQDMDWPQWNYFVGTWQISDIYSYQRFIFQDNAGREYFLASEKDYQIGDSIWLNWYVSPAYTWSKNIFDLQSQRHKIRPRGQSTHNRDTEISSLSGFFSYEFDYPKRLMMKWFYGTIFEQNSVILTEKCCTEAVSAHLWSNPYTDDGKNRLLRASQWQGNCQNNLSFLQSIRKSLQQKITDTYWKNPKAGLILWMLVWDRSQIPPDEYDWFIDSWLVHIIAVSGWNIIMIVVFLGAILFFLPFYVRNAVILATIIFYAMICGMDSSVFRATIMWWLWMLALFWWREVNIRRAMSIAFIIMLAVNPYFLAYDVWFSLSFSAIIGIVYFGKWVENIKTPGSNWQCSRDPGVIFKFLQKLTKDYITPTIWATLWVLPVILFFMGKTNLTWIIANFLVVPIIAIVMIYGFISTMLFQIFPRQFILRPEKLLLTYIYSISDFAGKRWIYIQAESMRVKYCLLAVFVVWFVSERFKK